MAGQLRLDGKVALVTGGASGIGRATCEALAARGATVVVNGNYRPSGAGPEEEVAAGIRANGGSAIGVNASVTDSEAVDRMIGQAIDAFGRLDIVVNNAGTSETRSLIDVGAGPMFDAQIDVHVAGTLRVTHAAWPHLLRSGHGRIVNTGSATALGGSGPNGYDMAYPVAKAALFGMTRQMAGAGRDHGIKVNLIMPWAESPMTIGALKDTPLGTWISEKAGAEKVAATILFLVHPDCPVSGEFITAAGGRIARIFYAQSKGIFDPAVTPEVVRDRWNEIAGATQSGQIEDFVELHSMEHEFEILQTYLGAPL